MPSYWPYTFLLTFLCESMVGLSGATRSLSLNSNVKIISLQIRLSVLTPPFYTSFPTLSPPPPTPPESRPLWSEVNVDIQYQVTAYLRTPEHEPESPMGHGPPWPLPPPPSHIQMGHNILIICTVERMSGQTTEQCRWNGTDGVTWTLFFGTNSTKKVAFVE